MERSGKCRETGTGGCVCLDGSTWGQPNRSIALAHIAASRAGRTQVMAQMLQVILGGAGMLPPKNYRLQFKLGDVLPSPEQLKNKVLLKGKTIAFEDAVREGVGRRGAWSLASSWSSCAPLSLLAIVS